MNRRLAELLHPASRAHVFPAPPAPAGPVPTPRTTDPEAPAPDGPSPPGLARREATVLVAGRGATGWARRLEADLGPAWQVVANDAVERQARWDALPEVVVVRGADFGLVAHLRSRFRSLPILVLDPGAAPATVVALYEAGVDQVVTTQSASVLSSHVRAVVRRQRSHAGAPWSGAGSAAGSAA